MNGSNVSGAVKITPAHDYNDFDVGSRHGLESPTVIDDQGHMTSVPHQFQVRLERVTIAS